MIDQSCALTRSKSDNVITKSLVWSPTPIRRQRLGFLDEFNHWQKFEDMALDESESPLAIRKFQSLGLLPTERTRLEEGPEPKASERQLFSNDDEEVASSSYPTLEIPVRASNPLIRDAKFCEANNEEPNYQIIRETLLEASAKDSCALIFH